MSADHSDFVQWIARGGSVTRAEAEELLGKADLAELIAAGKVAHNPWTGKIEIAQPTEDFYP
jgi:hypothetical protein